MISKTSMMLLMGALLSLAACSEDQQPANPDAAAEAADQKNGGTWDVGVATQEATNDTQAALDEAARHAGQMIENRADGAASEIGEAADNASNAAANLSHEAVGEGDRVIGE